MLIALTRTLSASDCTEGSLVVGTQTFATMELPWLDDLADKSCVPLGSYELNPYESPAKGLVYRLHNPALGVYGYGAVPSGGRSAIEMHPANWARQLLGCIAVGLSHGELVDPTTGLMTPAILESQAAMAEFRRLLGNTVTHTLSIVSAS